MDELYLENIDEFVNDHNKIVTYKWLSLSLGVHVNLAKQMLYHYLEQKRRDSSSQLHATYLVSGKSMENGHMCHKVSVVREDQLEDVKSKLSLTVSVHVYSVQKAVLRDSSPLYTVDYDAVKDNLKNCSRYSAIRCASAVPRSPAEVQDAREMTQAAPRDTQQVKPGVNGHASLPAKSTSKQPKGIMGMFANNKSASKNPESEREVKIPASERTSKNPESEREAECPKSKPAAKTNAMSNFFGKQAAKKCENTVKEEAAPQPSSQLPSAQPSSPVKRPPVSAAEETEMQRDVKEELPKEAVVEKDRSKTKRLDLSDDDEEDKTEFQKKKRRRRIKKPLPDSGDEDEEVEVIPDSPRGKVVKDLSPSPEREVKKEAVSHPDEHSESKRRKRRRVLKSKTFLDDEGCIVTEKGYESESYSETEDDVQANKPTMKSLAAPAKLAPGKKDKEAKKTQKKAAASANKTTKQASIMGFFQKK